MAAELYKEFFGFSERPFTLLPDPDFLFWSDQHRRAYTVLEYGLSTGAPLTVVTGEVGAGKTTLIQHLLSSMDENITTGLISNAHGERGHLLQWVLFALGVDFDPNADYIAAFEKFQDFVIDEYAASRHVLLVIDEAQNLSADALEELRMLTNMNSNKDELLQLILVGQPELREIISRPSMEQFAQRVSVTFHLKPLDVSSTQSYIKHRLQHVGGTGEEFTPSAVERIYHETGGVPRMINKICDLSLVYAASDGRQVVDDDVVGELVEDGLFVKTRRSEPYVLLNSVRESIKGGTE